MIQEHDIREKVDALLRREISLRVFEQWLGSESWDLFRENSDAMRFVAGINLLVSEFHDDVIRENEFRSELEALLNKQPAEQPAERAISIQIIVSLVPAVDHQLAVQRNATVVRPVVVPQIQIPLYVN